MMARKVSLVYVLSSRYLFTEYHWDQGPPHGTVKPIVEVGELEDKTIPLVETLGAREKETNTPVHFDSTNGRWVVNETGEPLKMSADTRIVSTPNEDLFDCLDNIISIEEVP